MIEETLPVSIGKHLTPMVTQCVCISVALIEDTVSDYKSMSNRHHPNDTATALDGSCLPLLGHHPLLPEFHSSPSGLSDHALTPHFRCPDRPVTGP